MPKRSPFTILLTEQEMSILQARVRRYTPSHRDALRAKIVQYAAKGIQNNDIAARLDTSAQLVIEWRKRFFEQRLEGLEEAPRRGRPGSFSPHLS